MSINRVLSALIVVAVFANSSNLAIGGESATKVLDDSLANNAAFSALKKYDPAGYKKMTAAAVRGINQGLSESKTEAAMEGDIVAYVQERLSRASDDAAAGYMRVTVKEMREVQSAGGGDLCYEFLFPTPGTAVNFDRYIPRPLKQVELSALADVIRTAAVTQPSPNQTDVEAYLQTVFTGMVRDYGSSDVKLLQNPHGVGINRKKVCELMIQMYSRILELPGSQGGSAIRLMVVRN